MLDTKRSRGWVIVAVVAGLVLFLMTLAFNILGHMARKRFREVY